MVTYLGVWALATAGDWMQGPYLYQIYHDHQLSGPAIELLLVAGFAASGVVGCFIGPMVDQFGRKRSCIMYCVLYGMSCAALHFNSYWIFLIGRVLGGVATSLLFSCFECWMVSQHTQKLGFSGGLLGYMFGLMFSTMYVVGIIAGFVGGYFEKLAPLTPHYEGSIIHWGGACNPFDAAIVCLMVAMVLIMCFFDENYGSQSAGGSCDDLQTIANNRTQALMLMLLGGVVSVFEGSMFVFVSAWWPAMNHFTIFNEEVSGDTLFSMFMMACMCGASASTLLGRDTSASMRLLLCFGAGIVAFAVMAYAAPHDTNSLFYPRLLVFGFLLFELCCGMYFPSVGVLKSNIVPEGVRGTVYNLYRLPLNAIVTMMLVSGLSPTAKFKILSLLMLVGFLCMLAIIGLEARAEKSAVCGRELNNALRTAEEGGCQQEMSQRASKRGGPEVVKA